MESWSPLQKALVTATVFGLIPCIVGIGLGQYLRWTDTIWLTDAGGFWPIVCLGASVAALARRAFSPFDHRASYIGAWLLVAWTWLYFPFWLTATEIPQSSAVISRDGRVFVASEWARRPEDKIWLLSGRAGTKFVRNVAGTVTVDAVEVRYRFAEPYIATRSHEEDISKHVISAVNAALKVEAGKSRSARIALFERRDVHDELLRIICRTVALDSQVCPLTLRLSPQSSATLPGAVWSKYYTEQEALEEKHLPTLVQLLTHETSQIVDQNRVFTLFLELADSVGELSRVARKSRIIDDLQFDELVRRILAAPGGGDEAVRLLIEVNHLKHEQRLDLRAKVLREASIDLIVKQAVPLRMSDADIAQLAVRMCAAFETSADVALLALEKFGERLPAKAQDEAIRAIVSANASYALAALQQLNFSADLRARLFSKVLADATYDDFDAARLLREKLEDVLTPPEMRALTASIVRRSESSPKWLNFAVRALPLRALTLAERKTVLNGLLFESAKSAFEFVSENRQYFEGADVNDVTYDYTKTITHDFCLHLSHRNRNRGVSYFSEAQLDILRDCAQSK